MVNVCETIITLMRLKEWGFVFALKGRGLQLTNVMIYQFVVTVLHNKMKCKQKHLLFEGYFYPSFHTEERLFTTSLIEAYAKYL